MPEHVPAGFPLARSNELVAETIGTETVVYDGLTKRAHYLAPLAASVFAASDGQTPLTELADIAAAKLGEPVNVLAVERALVELEQCELMETGAAPGISRREALRSGALVGAAALAAPLVVSLVTPEYGAASSLSSLSYVVVVFKDASGTYYRAKKGSDGSIIFGWSFATPGTDCTLTPAPANTSDNAIAGLAIIESTGSGGTTQITVYWTDTSLKLVDVRIKCSNDCHIALQNGNVGCSSGTCSFGPVDGCP